jgi:hypothetical protein
MEQGSWASRLLLGATELNSHSLPPFVAGMTFSAFGPETIQLLRQNGDRLDRDGRMMHTHAYENDTQY